MKFVYLIGNGFDLNHGLKTRYSDFYQYYLKVENPNEIIEKFKKTIEADLVNWSDLEVKLGEYTNQIDDESYYIEILEDVQTELSNYLIQEQNKISFEAEIDEKIGYDLFHFEKYFNEREKKEYNLYKEPLTASKLTADIIIFNYTNTFEKLYSYNGQMVQLGSKKINNTTFGHYLNSVEHIHGTVNDNMIMGVNDMNQISNKDMHTLSVERSIVKSTMNYNAGTLRDDRCKALIEKADVICIYGMSLGSTDKIWWEYVIRRMKSSPCRLVVFSVCSEQNSLRTYKMIETKDSIRNKLLSYVDLSVSDIKSISNRIYVCLNSKMFKKEKKKELVKAS